VRRALVVLLACAGPDMPPPGEPVALHAPAAHAAPDRPPVDPLDPEGMSEFASSEGPDTVPGITSLGHLASLRTTTRAAGAARAEGGEVWLKGSTHVHARASGDSGEPNAKVIAWYDQHHYDFIVLTDHNRVSELDAASDTRGQPTLRAPQNGLIVFSGIELTHNPIGCLPVGDPSGNCRIHVNLLGPTARPGGRLE